MYFYTGKAKKRLLIFDYTPKEQEWAIKTYLINNMGRLVQTVCNADLMILNKSKKPPSAAILKTAEYLDPIKEIISDYEAVIFSGTALAKNILCSEIVTSIELHVKTDEKPFSLSEKMENEQYNIKITSMRKPPGCLKVRLTGMNLDISKPEGAEFLESVCVIPSGEIIEKKINFKRHPFYSKAKDGMYTITNKDGIRYGFTEQPSFFYKKFATEMKSIIERDIDFVHQGESIDTLNIEKIEVHGPLEELQKLLILKNDKGDLLPVSIDLEGSGLNPWEFYDLLNRNSDDVMNRQVRDFLDDNHRPHDIISIAVATDINKGYSFLVDHPRIKSNDNHQGLEMLRWVAGLPNPKVLHNAKFEYKWICEYYGIVMNGKLTDTMVNEHLLNEGMFSGTNRYSLKGLTAMVLKLIPHKDEYLTDIITGIDKNPLPPAKDITLETIQRLSQHAMGDIISARNKDFSLMKKKDLHSYGPLDVVLPLRILNAQMAEFKKRKMQKAWKWIVKDLVDRESRALGKMEYKGFPLNTDRVMEIVEHCDKFIAGATEELREVFGDIKFNSPKTLDPILEKRYPDLYPLIPRTAKGELSIKEELVKKHGNAYPWLYPLFTFRHAHKIRGTYMIPFMQYASAGRTHFNFNIAGPATGRLSSYEPNMQNIPKYLMGILVKDCHVPETGQILINVDLNNAEMRMLANMSGDANLTEMLQKGMDMHSYTAAGATGVPYADIKAASDVKGEKTEQEKLYCDYRQNAKPVNFGIAYGISGKGVSDQTGCTVAEGDAMIKKFFQTYPGIDRFLNDVEAEGLATGYAETFTGRRRYFPLLQKEYRRYVDKYVVQKMIRQLKNFTIQSPTSDLFQYVIADIVALPGVTPHITVHDSIVFSFDYKRNSLLELYDSLYKVIVEQTAELWPGFFTVKMNFDVEIGPAYGKSIKLPREDIAEVVKSGEDLLEYYERVSKAKKK